MIFLIIYFPVCLLLVLIYAIITSCIYLKKQKNIHCDNVFEYMFRGEEDDPIIFLVLPLIMLWPVLLPIIIFVSVLCLPIIIVGVIANFFKR